MDISANLISETTSSFRTAYAVAKDLRELNGAVVGEVHRSDHSCAEIIDHIAHGMKKKLVRTIREKTDVNR